MPIVHDLKPRQKLDHVLFIGTFLLGCSGILFLKYHETYDVWVAIFPAVVLIFYALLAWGLTRFRLERFRLEPETIGDNCYYLGFIFTLVSLASTLYGLYGFTQVVRDTDPIPEIVSGFGVALSSTIVGIFLRVLFIQFRPDVVTSDREARIELNQAVQEFKSELTRSIIRLKGFSTEVEQALSEQRKNFEETDNERMERQAEWLKEYTETVGKEMAGVVNSTTDTIQKLVHDKINETSNDWTALLDTTSDRLAKTIDDYSSRLDAASGKIEVTAEQIAVSIGQMRVAIEKSSEAVDAIGHGIDSRLQSVAKDFEAVATTIGAASDALNNTSTEVQAFFAKLKDNPKSEATFDSAQLKSLEDAVRDMTAALQKPSRKPGKRRQDSGWWRPTWL